ncbi:ETC complex I subunit conserved region-domain-containing protein [Baffinella frigidus]|nr:ETC complex I subunit conserved region-domain-containing protein [Cryptophyta sp. CCMP2293]
MAALASLRRLALTSKATRTAPTAGYAACFALARGPAVKSFSTTAAVKVGSTDGDIFARTGLNPEIYTSRKVVIFKPPPSAISSGPYSTSKWHLSFDAKHKWANPLMGWTSSKDTLGVQAAAQMTFSTSDLAVKYCEKHGIEYDVAEEQPPKLPS